MNTKYFYKIKEILVLGLILISSVMISSLSTFYILNRHQNIFIRSIIFSLLIILSGKFILKVDYNEIKIDLKTIKYNIFDNIYFALIISFLSAALSTIVYQAEFIIAKDKAITINDILSSSTQVSTDNMGLLYIFSVVLVIFIEELFFRFLTFKYIVKDESNKKDIYLFIYIWILYSIYVISWIFYSKNGICIYIINIVLSYLYKDKKFYIPFNNAYIMGFFNIHVISTSEFI